MFWSTGEITIFSISTTRLLVLIRQFFQLMHIIFANSWSSHRLLTCRLCAQLLLYSLTSALSFGRDITHEIARSFGAIDCMRRPCGLLNATRRDINVALEEADRKRGPMHVFENCCVESLEIHLARYVSLMKIPPTSHFISHNQFRPKIPQPQSTTPILLPLTPWKRLPLISSMSSLASRDSKARLILF